MTSAQKGVVGTEVNIAKGCLHIILTATLLTATKCGTSPDAYHRTNQKIKHIKYIHSYMCAHTYAMEFSSATKKNDLMPLAGGRTELGTFMSTERS